MIRESEFERLVYDNPPNPRHYDSRSNNLQHRYARGGAKNSNYQQRYQPHYQNGPRYHKAADFYHAPNQTYNYDKSRYQKNTYQNRQNIGRAQSPAMIRKSSRERSNFTKYLDITTMSRISSEKNSTDAEIRRLEAEIRSLKMPEEPSSAEKLFENKIFNQIK